MTSDAGLVYEHLENLFVVLGLKADEIENAKQLEDTKSFKLQAASVLQWWRKIQGSAATKQVIIEALAECQYAEAVGILREKWGLASGGKAKTPTYYLTLSFPKPFCLPMVVTTPCLLVESVPIHTSMSIGLFFHTHQISTNIQRMPHKYGRP